MRPAAKQGENNFLLGMILLKANRIDKRVKGLVNTRKLGRNRRGGLCILYVSIDDIVGVARRASIQMLLGDWAPDKKTCITHGLNPFLDTRRIAKPE